MVDSIADKSKPVITRIIDSAKTASSATNTINTQSDTSIFDKYQQWQSNGAKQFEENYDLSAIEDFTIFENYSPDTYVDDMKNFSQQYVDKLDENNSGAIDYDEFEKQELDFMKETYGEEIDVNAPITSSGQMTQFSLDSFNQSDASGDGKIDYNEFLKGEVELYNSYCDNEEDKLVYDEETNTLKTSDGIDLTEDYQEYFQTLSNDKDYIEQSDYMKNDVSLLNEIAGEEQYAYDEATNSIIDRQEEPSEYKTYGDLLSASYSAMDLNGDNAIDTNESGAYFAALDSADSNEGQVDGKISFQSTMFDILSTPNLKAVYEDAYSYFQ